MKMNLIFQNHMNWHIVIASSGLCIISYYIIFKNKLVVVFDLPHYICLFLVHLFIEELIYHEKFFQQYFYYQAPNLLVYELW